MAFEKKVPEWNAAGSEPPATLKNSGFTAGYKPPADYFNWFWYSVSQCLTELQNEVFSDIAATVASSDDLDDYMTVGMYTYSAADSKTIRNVPEVGQGTLFVLPRLTNGTADADYRIQVIITQSNTVYVRNAVGGSWNDWCKFFKDNDIIPVKNGGTGANSVTNARKALGLPEVCTTVTNWDDAITNGWFMGNNATNAPTSGSDVWFFGHVITHNSNYVLQEVYKITSSADAKYMAKYIRAKMNGAWGAWVDVTVQAKVPVDAILNGAKQDLSNVTDEVIKARVSGVIASKTITPYAVELHPANGATSGGFIDFHFAGDNSKDYTSRIIEDVLGELRIVAKVKVEGDLYENGVHRVYSTGNKPSPSDIGAAKASEHKMITYSSLADIGLSAGKETIDGISRAMADGSMLVYQADSASNTAIYPATNLVVTVKRVNMNRVEFIATRADGAQIWFGDYHISSAVWTGWNEIYHTGAKPTPAQIGAAASSHNQAASTISAGTFAGQVVANSSGQAVGTSLLRNSKLVSADTNPTVNGEINWTYK